ncbi:MAG: hypothetical protein LBD59_05730 [Prevotellaceae bacterium]|jgi:hypothetical protein|nr:hypothetical protein [Prevotellaceae bacterium]
MIFVIVSHRRLHRFYKNPCKSVKSGGLISSPQKKFLTFFKKICISKKIVYLCAAFVTDGDGCKGLIFIIIQKKRREKRSKKIWKIEEKGRKIEENLKAD